MGRTQPDEEDPPPPEPTDEPVEGPARLFIGAPRTVTPTGVRPFGDSTTGVDEAAPDPARTPDDWEERLRWTGLDRSARTRVEDVDGRRDRERQERSRSRTQPGAWDALAKTPAPRGVAPVASEEYATEPALPAPRAPRAAISEPPAEPPPPPPPRPGGAATRAAAADARVSRGPAAPRFSAAAANPSQADEDFFTSPAPARAGARNAGRSEPARAVEPVAPPPAGRFVPRNQRPLVPNAGSSPVLWFVAGFVLIGGALGVVWWRIRGDVETPVEPTVPSVAVVEVGQPEAFPPPVDPPPEAPAVVTPPPVQPAVEPPIDPAVEPLVEPPVVPVVTAPVPPPVEPPPAAVPPPVKPPVVVSPPPPVVLLQPLPTPKPPKTNPIPSETGVLLVSAREPVRVRVDGKVIGDRSSKHEIKLPIGEHKVVLSAASGSQTFPVRIDEARPTQIEFKSR